MKEGLMMQKNKIRELNDAIWFCDENLRRFARLYGGGKEKYGHYIQYYSLWRGALFDLIQPHGAYVSPRWRVLAYDIDPILVKIFDKTGLRWLFTQYQLFIYNIVMQRAVKKWPHLKRELLSNTSFPESITPGIFGPIDGVREYNRYRSL
jgi:hypothetical protein